MVTDEVNTFLDENEKLPHLLSDNAGATRETELEHITYCFTSAPWSIQRDFL